MPSEREKMLAGAHYTLFGPGRQILTPVHSMNAELRREEYGQPIETKDLVGMSCWSTTAGALRREQGLPAPRAA